MESKPLGIDVDDDPEGESFVEMARAAMPGPQGRHRRRKWLAAIGAVVLVAASLSAVLSTVNLSAQPGATRHLAASVDARRAAGGAATGATGSAGTGSRTPGSTALTIPRGQSRDRGGSAPSSAFLPNGPANPLDASSSATGRAPSAVPLASPQAQAPTSTPSGSGGLAPVAPQAPPADGGAQPAGSSSPQGSQAAGGAPSSPSGPAPSLVGVAASSAPQPLTFSESEEVGPGSATCCSAQTGAWSQFSSGGADDGTGPVLYHLGGATSDPGEQFDWSLGNPTAGSRWDQVRVYVWIPTHMAGAHVVYSIRDLHGTVQVPLIQETHSGWYFLGTFAAGIPGNRSSSVWVTMTYAGTYWPSASEPGCGAAGCDAWAASRVRFAWS